MSVLPCYLRDRRVMTLFEPPGMIIPVCPFSPVRTIVPDRFSLSPKTLFHVDTMAYEQPVFDTLTGRR